ncbi:type VI secretion system protein TssL, long form [Erwinia sorbitola]|uniref:Type VI secretion system protein TssL n=1 Tax=Erwinia sorbitola TaxID=2681984 RepID=A0ABW9RGV4_9GAMM|nr:type VI secretion system protein TssL, long form [Erwinia sorbitola]MTD28151.1 type VI secretion system protein TssL [Erwinia sorbitola]
MSELQDNGLATELVPPEEQKPEEMTPQALGRFLPDEHTVAADRPLHAINEDEEIEAFLRSEKDYLNETSLRSEGVQQRLVNIRQAENPLLEASQPLLRALSEMPEHVESMEYVEVLKRSIKNEVNLFAVVCEEIDVSWKKMAIVRYCLCTAIDEAAHARAWAQSAGWSQSNLLNHFEGDNDGGNKFFLLVGRLSMNPHEYADVLEVLLRILGLGFEGRYSIIEDGDRQLTKIRQRLLTIIQSTRDTTSTILSPHGLVKRGKQKREKLIVPVRVTLLLCGILIASLFFWYKYWLTINKSGIAHKILAMQQINMAKPAVKKLRLAYLLRHEIAKGLVNVDETKDQSKVVFKSDSVFDSGATSVKPAMDYVMNRVAREVLRVNGSVLVVGHTDAMPIHRPGIENNIVLSELRAKAVASYFINTGLAEGKIKIQGVGDTQPLTNNSTPEGRAQNRRVEFFVTY